MIFTRTYKVRYTHVIEDPPCIGNNDGCVYVEATSIGDALERIKAYMEKSGCSEKLVATRMQWMHSIECVADAEVIR